MVIALPLRNAARYLVDTFGNTATRYAFTSVTKTTNDEGEDTISSWGTATTFKIVDGGTSGTEQIRINAGIEQIGEDEKILRDDITILMNDRVTYNGREYRVTSFREERTETTTIIKVIRVSEVTSTTTW